MKPGLHIANVATDDAWREIDWGAYTLLHDQRALLPTLPKDRIKLVRFYLPDWYHTGARAWAELIADVYNRGVKQWTKHITWANEMNLRDEGHPLARLYTDHPRNMRMQEIFDAQKWLVERNSDSASVIYPPRSVYEDIRDWNLTVIKELRRLCPDAILHFPALSQGHSDDQNDAGYVGFEILRPAVEACDYLDVHTYWNGEANRESVYYGKRYEKAHSLFPNKRLFVSEFGSDVDMQSDNGQDYVAWLQALPSYIEGACAFIWDSDSANAGWRIRVRPNIVKSLKEYKELPTPVPINYQDIADKQYPSKNVNAIAIAAMCLRAGMTDPLRGIAIALWESDGGNPQAIHVNKDGSIDRGLWQLNNKQQPYSDECALNPMCATLAAAEIYKKWKGWGAWSSYKSGDYLKYMGIARLALAALGKG